MRETVKTLAVAAVLFLLGLACLLQGLRVEAQAQGSELEWTQIYCAHPDCVIDILRTLPPERALEAKTGAWQGGTYVWYRVSGVTAQRRR